MIIRDDWTGLEQRPIDEAPKDGRVILAKSRDGATYMKVCYSGSGSWWFDDTQEVAHPAPHWWLVQP